MYTLLICCLRTSRPTKYVLRYSSNSAVFFKKSKRTWDFWNAPAISAQKDPLRFRDSPPHSALRSKRQNCLCRLFASNPLKKLQWKIFRDFAVDPHQTDKHFTFFLDWFIDIYSLLKCKTLKRLAAGSSKSCPKTSQCFWRIIRQVFSKTFRSQDAGDSSPFSAGTWRVPDTNLTNQRSQHDESIPSQVEWGWSNYNFKQKT